MPLRVSHTEIIIEIGRGNWFQFKLKQKIFAAVFAFPFILASKSANQLVIIHFAEQVRM